MSTEIQSSKEAFPALFKVGTEESFGNMVYGNPLEALKHVIRTTEDLKRAVKGLERQVPCDPDEMEALILALHRKSEETTVGVVGRTCFDAKKKVIELYAACDYVDRSERSYADILRAFRFLIGTVASTHHVGGGKVVQTFLCDWDDDSIKRMVKRHPFLYWSHVLYLEKLVTGLEYVIEKCKGDLDSPFCDHNWTTVERAIRRIVDVDVGDWKQIGLISKIKDLCDREVPTDDYIEYYYDRFRASQARALLTEAHTFLCERKGETQYPNEFGHVLEQVGGLQSSVVVNVDLPQVITLPNEKCADLVGFSVSIYCSDEGEGGKLIKVLKKSQATLEIDGGYIVEDDNKKTPLHDLEKDFPEIEKNKIEFFFVPFVGRSRLTLRLSFSPPRGKEDIEVVIPFFVETKVAVSEEEVVA